MREIARPRDAAPELKRNCVIELDYLDAGRRVFVATDENGWLIGHGMALSDQEAEKVLRRLHESLENHRTRPRPQLMP